MYLLRLSIGRCFNVNHKHCYGKVNSDDNATKFIYLLVSIELQTNKEYELIIYNFSFKMNIWDVGGQKSLRSYWRNYFESTDGLVWVVDSTDKRRLADCVQELHQLLVEEVNC